AAPAADAAVASELGHEVVGQLVIPEAAHAVARVRRGVMARRLALEALEQTAVPVAYALAALGPALVDDGEARARRTERRAARAGEARGTERVPLGIRDGPRAGALVD